GHAGQDQAPAERLQAPLPDIARATPDALASPRRMHVPPTRHRACQRLDAGARRTTYEWNHGCRCPDLGSLGTRHRLERVPSGSPERRGSAALDRRPVRLCLRGGVPGTWRPPRRDRAGRGPRPQGPRAVPPRTRAGPPRPQRRRRTGAATTGSTVVATPIAIRPAALRAAISIAA